MTISRPAESTPVAGTDKQIGHELSILFAVVESLGDPAYVAASNVGGGHRYVCVNAAFATYAGQSIDEVVGRSPQDLFGDDLGSQIARRWSDAADLGEVTNYSNRAETPIGERIVDITLSPLPSLFGSENCLIGVLRDATESERTKVRLETLFRYATDGVLMALQDGTVTELTLGGSEIWGARSEDLAGSNVGELVHPDDRSVSEAAWRHAAARPGQAFAFQVRSRRGTDEWGWVDGEICDLSSDESVGAVVVALRDCDDRRQAQDRLEATENRLRALVTNASEALVGVDLDQTIVLWNRAAEEMFGWAENEIVGRSLTLLLPEAMRSHHHELLGSFARAGTERTRIADRAEVQALRSNGEVFPVEIQLAKIPIEDGLMLMASVRDISGRRSAEIAADRAHADLGVVQIELIQAQKLESVGRLAGGIAHEINTPMQYIGDNTHFLKGAVLRLLAVAQAAEVAISDSASADDRLALADALHASKLPMLLQRAPKAADDALSGVENVSRIVTAMKRFSHPGSDEMTPVDLNDAITTTMMVCRSEWKYSAEIVTDLSDSLPLIEGHLGSLNQVWLNMIINSSHAIADHHGENKGLITIASAPSASGNQVQVTISDNGAGISQENLERVFDHFFTTKEVGKGTGQGLAIAHQTIVAEHHGTLTVDSIIDKGTTFTITLPTTQPTYGPTKTS